MSWFIAAILASLAWAVVQLVDKTLISTEVPSIHLYWVTTGVATLAPVLLMPIVWPRHVAFPSAHPVLLAILAGVCYFISNAFFFRAVQSIDTSVSSAALAAVPGLTAVGSWLILSEKLTWISAAGIVAITIGVIVMSQASNGDASSKQVPATAWTALGIAELVLVTEYLIEGFVAKHVHPLTVFFWTRIGILCAVTVLALIKPKLIQESVRWAFVRNRKVGLLTITNECLDALAVALLIFGYRSGPVGLTTAVAYTQSAFVFLFTLTINVFWPGVIPTKGDRPGRLIWRISGLVIVLMGVLLANR